MLHARPSSVYRDSATVHAWLLTEDDARYPPIWLHDVLTKTAARYMLINNARLRKVAAR